MAIRNMKPTSKKTPATCHGWCRTTGTFIIMMQTILLILLALNNIEPTKQYFFHDASEPTPASGNAEKAHAEHHQHVPPSSLTNHDKQATNSEHQQQHHHQQQQQRQSPLAQIYTHNDDPFAVTFEDYLKEASQISAHQIADEASESAVEGGGAIPAASSVEPLINTNTDSAPPSPAPLAAKTKESVLIDYIFPAPKQETTPTSHPVAADSTTTTTTMSNNLTGTNSTSTELFNEIRLLFAWKQLPTNKCSKTCGRGYRVNHLSCVDLKYKVRVEDSLCSKANLPKPKETSDESCNEIDCPPEWVTVEFQQCSTNISPEGTCHTDLYKRAQCQMINKDGTTVLLDDFRCDQAIKPSTTTTTKSPLDQDSQKVEPSTGDAKTKEDQMFDGENIEISADYTQVDNPERNDILSNIGHIDMSSGKTTSETKAVHPHNEPFFETGPWSECSGAPCGQLGQRTRSVSCRLYLSRSSKFTELPHSSCQMALIPDKQEPCYIDCPPESPSKNGSTEVKIQGNDDGNEDETVYEVDLARFIWRQEGWTKCSADCLGGRRESMIECWDKTTETLVDSSLCDIETKPQPLVEGCNDIPCPPEWLIGPFTKCTRPCGSAGIKTRSVTCVQKLTHRGGLSVVANEFCAQTNGSMPHKLEPCNRIDCRPEWNVGPWSECSKKCGEGIKNRTVICVQEFAHRDGPLHTSIHKYSSPDLLEAIAISSKDWHPGKATQVPFQECYSEYKTVPPIDERCSSVCEKEPYIDADSSQNYHMSQEAMRRRTVTLRVGGKAEVLEGRNLKIRCKLMGRDPLSMKPAEPIEWRKDGIRIFANGSTMADKQYIADDNSIFGNDVFADDRNQFMADDPNSRGVTKQPAIVQRHHQHHSKPRNLMVRSWDQAAYLMATHKNYRFVPQLKGRFSIVKENNLRIKRLRFDDSGTYTCSYGSMSESLELKVISRRDLLGMGERLDDNYGQQ